MSESEHGTDVGRPDPFWNRVYIAVVINTVVVVSLLYGFSKYFSI
jgi:hypothetical protein